MEVEDALSCTTRNCSERCLMTGAIWLFVTSSWTSRAKTEGSRNLHIHNKIMSTGYILCRELCRKQIKLSFCQVLAINHPDFWCEFLVFLTTLTSFLIYTQHAHIHSIVIKFPGKNDQLINQLLNFPTHLIFISKLSRRSTDNC